MITDTAITEKGEAMGEWIVDIIVCLVVLAIINAVFFVMIGSALDGTKTGKAIDEAVARWIKREEKR